MNFLLAELDFLEEREPYSAALNMAIDETLLRRVARPTLRVYGWSAPAVSFGYFEKWAPVGREFPNRELVRRWTGGGVVPHGQDFTYSLLVPCGGALANMNAELSYCAIHRAVGTALRDAGFAVSAFLAETKKVSPACFANPVRSDVVLNDCKVAGAAQRRTVHGLLHQGSIQTLALSPDFAAGLAAAMSPAIRPVENRCLEEAGKLAETKYATESWTRKF